jgi:transposase
MSSVLTPTQLTTLKSYGLALFAGSDGGGGSRACVASLIETSKLNDVEPYVYLQDILLRLVAGYPVNRIDELLPWNWKATRQ